MKYSKKIYKKDSKGKIRITHVQADNGVVIQESGLLGGALVKHTSTSKPKNIGKTNSTTPEEQAIFEAKAKIEKKLKEGYFESIEEAKNEEIIMPMLAKVYEKEAKKVDWSSAYVQPKLDGMRGLKKKSVLKSRTNRPIETLFHITSLLPEVEEILDGELYAHGLSFQENMKLIKKYRKGETEKVKYHVYDLVISNMNFIDRYNLLSSLVKNVPEIELVPTYKVNSFEEMQKYHTKFLSQGYEGTMLRWGNEGYKMNGRSSNLLKYKNFLDEVYEVIDVEPSDKNPIQGVVVCKNFKCGMKFSHSDREEILKNKDKYIGKMAEIRFFEYTDEGVPRFPVCVGFRLDK